MDFNPSIPGYVFEYVPTPLASHIGNFIVKKLPFYSKVGAIKITGIFDENHELTLLTKCKFFDHSKIT